MASNSDKNPAASEELSRKKRPALADATNLNPFSRSTLIGSSKSKPMVPCVAKIAKTRNEFTEPSKHTFPAALRLSSGGVVIPKNTSFPCDSQSSTESMTLPSSSNINVPLGESLSRIEAKRNNRFSIPDDVKRAGDRSKRDALVNGETANQAIEMDKSPGPQFRATTTCDIYKHLRESEVKYRPSMEFIERTQIDIDPSMRATLIDWLVEVSEEYRLVGDTLFLSVNYTDRYLSGKVIRRQKLQLLGVACMMIAAKYEEVSPPHVEEFCYITDNTYLKEEILSMETAVLDHLKFKMAAPTTICFLRRFISAALPTSEVLSTKLECLANYIAELSLLNFSILHYPPSLVAASATFLASYLLSPCNRPWNSALKSCTMYQASDLCDCVTVLHHLCRSGGGRHLSAIRNKYSHHKYKCVAKKYCPPSIPVEFFEDVSG